MRKLFWEMSIKEPCSETGTAFELTVVQIDSLAAKSLVLNKKVSVRSKHIDLEYHFVTAASKNKIIILED